MKNSAIFSFLALAFTVHISCQQNKVPEHTIPELFEEFKYTSDHAIYEQHSYYNFTNKSSISSNISQFGIKAVFAPPYFFGPCDINLTLFDEEIPIESYEWYPSESIFKGKILNGIQTEARLVPLNDERGGIYEVTISNVSEKELDIPVQWSVKGTLGMQIDWAFNRPDLQGPEINMDGTDIDKTDTGYYLVKDKAETEMSIMVYGADYEHLANGGFKKQVRLKPGDSITLGIVIVIGKKNEETKNKASEIVNNVSAHISKTRKVWEDDLTEIMQKAPRVEGVSDEMQKFYNTGLLSLLSVQWEVPEFLFSPWIAACGIDGGAMISYLWDHALPSKFISLLSPKATRNHILAFAKADMYNNYAVNPTTGEGVGPFYSYNYHALALLVYDYVSMTGDFSILDEPVGEGTYLDFLYEFCLGAEDLDQPADLVDYGSNENLLELKKTDAYQHFTPSPNAERLLIYDMLTELYAYRGKTTPHDLLKRKQELTKVFREKLWNEELGWPNTLDQQGNRHVCYSIQVFDALRTGIYTPEMKKAVVSHLNENEFLSKWGVHSLSKEDQGYDSEDVDWGGPGVYTVDAPELMTDLLNNDFFDEGIDVLNRIVWWGDLPYYPQSMRANIKGYRENGRSNLISGVGIPMHIAFGLFRMKVTTNSLKIHPIEHDYMKGVAMKDYKLRGHIIDVEVSADRKNYTVTVDGKIEKLSSDKAFTLVLN